MCSAKTRVQPSLDPSDSNRRRVLYKAAQSPSGDLALWRRVHSLRGRVEVENPKPRSSWLCLLRTAERRLSRTLDRLALLEFVHLERLQIFAAKPRRSIHPGKQLGWFAHIEASFAPKRPRSAAFVL